jgi:hypothetical protein
MDYSHNNYQDYIRKRDEGGKITPLYYIPALALKCAAIPFGDDISCGEDVLPIPS